MTKQTKKRRPASKSRQTKPSEKKDLRKSTGSQLEFTSAVIAASPVGLVVIDVHGRIQQVNNAALEVFDINRDSVILPGGRRQPSVFVELLPEKEQSRWQYMINMVLSTRDNYSDDRFFHHTGYVEKVLAVRLSPMPFVETGEEGLVMTVEDVTDSVLMEKYLILSEKLVAKGELATSVAHELNTHIDAATQSAQTLQENLEDEDYQEAEASSKAITQSLSRIRHFVDNLIDFSKPHTEYISYDIKHLIEDLLFSLRIQPRFKQTHFTIDLGRDVPSLEMDVGQIQQVFMNILNNAADAIEEKAIEYQAEGCELKREIEILASFDRLSERVIIDISDNGVGMTEETMGQIFNMHFSTKKHGHGLGLYNCRKIVEQHHGELLAQSEYGEGATFRIILPCAQPHLE